MDFFFGSDDQGDDDCDLRALRGIMTNADDDGLPMDDHILDDHLHVLPIEDHLILDDLLLASNTDCHTTETSLTTVEKVSISFVIITHN